MKTIRLTATKPHRYGTRHLVAGEDYEVPPRHAAALVATRKARFAKPATTVSDMLDKVEEIAQAQAEDEPPDERRTELEALRADAEKLGIAVDRRWGVTRITFEIAQAQATK